MPRNRGIRGEQWHYCMQCGREYPMSQMGYQKGLMICFARCWDNLEIERHSDVVAQVLNAGVDEEGVDQRFVNDSLLDNKEVP